MSRHGRWLSGKSRNPHGKSYRFSDATDSDELIRSPLVSPSLPPMKLLERVAELEGENRRLLSEYADARAEAVRRVDGLAAAAAVPKAKTTPTLWLMVALLVVLTSAATGFVTSGLVARFSPTVEESW